MWQRVFRIIQGGCEWIFPYASRAKRVSLCFYNASMRSGQLLGGRNTALYEFILKAVKEFHIDPRRVYLTGLSMGGYGTWYTAMRHPELFAAIAPVCGGGMVWNAGALDMPIWAFHGTEDSVVYPTETMNMINRIRILKKNNYEVKMTLVDKVGHGVWDIAYQEELLEWLLTKSK